MALTKEKKAKSLESIKAGLAKQKSMVFADFSKVNSKDLFSLRKQLKEAGCLLKIGKKTLVRIAFGQSKIQGWSEVAKNVPGQLALIFGIEDELNPAKISQQFAKTNEAFTILGGIFEKKFVDKAQVLVLASLPSRQELLAKMVGSLASPISGFENALIGNTRSFVSLLSRIKTS